LEEFQKDDRDDREYEIPSFNISWYEAMAIFGVEPEIVEVKKQQWSCDDDITRSRYLWDPLA